MFQNLPINYGPCVCSTGCGCSSSYDTKPSAARPTRANTARSRTMMRIAVIAPPDYRDFEGLNDKEANRSAYPHGREVITTPLQPRTKKVKTGNNYFWPIYTVIAALGGRGVHWYP